MRIKLCGVGVDTYSFDEVVERITDHVSSSQKPEYVVTPNAQHIVVLQKDNHFRKIYQDAFLSVPDGVPLLWAAKFLGKSLNGRVNGTDLFERLCEVAAEKKLRIFLLGGRPGAAERASQILTNRHPGLTVSGFYCPPYGFESDPNELAKIEDALRLTKPDILFVGLGAPKQEYWIYENYEKLNIPISLGIGVSFELVSGMVQRAPVWMQNTGLEWLFRLFAEPQRLWKRYLVGNTVFLWLVLKQKLSPSFD